MVQRAVSIGLFAVVVLASAFVGAAHSDHGAGPASAQAASDRPSNDVNLRLSVTLDDGAATKFELLVAYPARSAAEADTARNGTLDLEWFHPDEPFQYVLTPGDGENVSSWPPDVRHRSSLWLRTIETTEPEHGWVVILHRVSWDGHVTPGEDVVIGPEYERLLAWDELTSPVGETGVGDANESDDVGRILEVHVPESWEPTTVSGDPAVHPAGQTETRYRWVGVDPGSDPLLAFESPVTPSSDDGSAGSKEAGPVGVAGGFVVTALALLVVGLRSRRW